jgi:hypothetical protein
MEALDLADAQAAVAAAAMEALALTQQISGRDFDDSAAAVSTLRRVQRVLVDRLDGVYVLPHSEHAHALPLVDRMCAHICTKCRIRLCGRHVYPCILCPCICVLARSLTHSLTRLLIDVSVWSTGSVSSDVKEGGFAQKDF